MRVEKLTLSCLILDSATLKGSGHEVCLDPEAPWVQRMLKRIMSRYVSMKVKRTHCGRNVRKMAKRYTLTQSLIMVPTFLPAAGAKKDGGCRAPRLSRQLRWTNNLFICKSAKYFNFRGLSNVPISCWRRQQTLHVTIMFVSNMLYLLLVLSVFAVHVVLFKLFITIFIQQHNVLAMFDAKCHLFIVSNNK